MINSGFDVTKWGRTVYMRLLEFDKYRSVASRLCCQVCFVPYLISHITSTIKQERQQLHHYSSASAYVSWQPVSLLHGNPLSDCIRTASLDPVFLACLQLLPLVNCTTCQRACRQGNGQLGVSVETCSLGLWDSALDMEYLYRLSYECLTTILTEWYRWHVLASLLLATHLILTAAPENNVNRVFTVK